MKSVLAKATIEVKGERWGRRNGGGVEEGKKRGEKKKGEKKGGGEKRVEMEENKKTYQ